MITWLQLTKLEYPIPATLEPGREYIFRIATDNPEHVSLTLDGEFVGNFHGGSLVFTTTSGPNELSLNSELDRQIVKGLTINEVETGYETRTSGFIKLFEATDKEFSSNGLLTIQPLKIFEVKKRSLNGWTIDVETPIEHKDFIEQDMLAVIQTKSKQAPQAFRISNIEYTQRKVKFTAHHVMFDADNYYIQKDDTSGTHNAASILQRINTKVDRTSPYVFTSDLNMSIDYNYSQLSLLEAMTLMEEQLGGNFDADNWNIKLSKNIGLDRGETIIYGKNLEDIKVFEDWSGVITRIFPEGKDGLILPEKYIDATIQYDIPYTKKIEFSSALEKPEEGEVDKEDLIVELRENAEAFLLESSKPKISYEVKSDINQSLEIGDTVYIKHPLVMIDAQVQEYEYDVIAGRVRKIVFGNYNRSVKKMFDKIKEDIKEVEKQTSKFEQVVNEQTDLIIGMNKFGHVYIDDNEILILDKLPKEEAINVWRWGLGGLGFSSTGYEGPFTQAWTMDGKFNTEFISAKSITANQLSSDVGSSLDLSSNTSINLIVTDVNGLNDKYAQIETDLDEIKQTVSNIDTTNNIIPNFQGYNGYKGWSWVGGSLKAVTGLTAMVGLRQSTNWIRRAVDSDAIYRLEFFTSGRAISPKGFVTGGEEYSYNTKVHHGTQGYTLTVREFDALDGAVQHETPFAIDTNELNPYFTFTLQPNTRYVDLVYDIPTTVTPTNTLSVTEQVFNKGRPGEFAFSVAEFVNKTESQISQLSDSVTTTVTKVETIDGQVIDNTSRISQNATNIALKANAIDLQGKVGFSDLSTPGRTNIVGDNITTGKVKSQYIDFNDAVGENVDLTGKMRVYHSDGSYTQMDGNGIIRKTSVQDREYHYLVHGANFVYGSASASSVRWIQLPNDFKGKQFEVFFGVADSLNVKSYWRAIQKLVCIRHPNYNIDYANARVPVMAYKAETITDNGDAPEITEIQGVLWAIY